MATFYGGEELVEHIVIDNTFVPSDQQKFDIYTVPTGFYGVIEKYQFAATDITTSNNYFLYVVHNFKQFGGERYKEKIASLVPSEYGNEVGAEGAININLAHSRGVVGFEVNDSGGLNFIGNSNSTSIVGGPKIYLDAGETIRFESITNSNSECQYYIVIHLYKKP
jgi:hypothetical protein